MSAKRLLLVNPANGPSFWGFDYAMDLLGRSYSNAPLSLLTVAALTPPGWDVRLVDENVEPLDLDMPCDVVGISAMNVQAARAFVIADAFRRRGRTVVIGGPFATLQPDRCAPHADVIVVGEAERTWPTFCRDFERGEHQPRYVETEAVDLAQSPVPRYDLLRPRAYASLPVQTSRGCPFSCEFCDIIVMLGRRVRTKRPEQVVAEFEAIRRAGGHSIFFTDDNFIGSPPRTRQLLSALIAERRRSGFAPLLFTQASVNLAEQPELLAAMVEAGFTRVFLGVETPRQESLLEADKRQNARGDLVARIHAIQRAGLMVWAGMIVGFDHDDETIFDEQESFLEEAGIPVAMVGMLNAPPRTPLYARLQAEGRIDPGSDWTDNCAWTNIVPRQMSRAQLFRGYRRLVQRLYDPRAYARRVLANIERMGPPAPGVASARPPSLADLVDLWRAVRRYTFSMESARRGHFVPNLIRVLAMQPRRVVEGAIHLGLWQHFGAWVPELSAALEHAEAAERVKERERAWRTAQGEAPAPRPGPRPLQVVEGAP